MVQTNKILVILTRNTFSFIPGSILTYKNSQIDENQQNTPPLDLTCKSNLLATNTFQILSVSRRGVFEYLTIPPDPFSDENRNVRRGFRAETKYFTKKVFI